MSRRSRKHKKRFDCGHRGFGRYCHCCAPKKVKKEAVCLTRQVKRSRLQQAFADDPIDLRHLPQKIVKKARQVITALEQGWNVLRLGGNHFHFDRTLIRVPVGYRYRLLCRRDQEGIHPLVVLSHEDYNAIARHQKQV
jgi:hypothetical protein